ncbi:copper transporter 6-like [Castanea sativa]|uniref:copper transporter 6-like n=1 Tax=Castanea sativa TaxID=21020 RepID=UPI003F64A0CF
METSSHNDFKPYNAATRAAHSHHQGIMTFFWGHNSEILFPGWPGNDSCMYALALVFVFVLAVLVEWLSYGNLVKPETNNVAAGLMKTAIYTLRSGLAYMVMLAVMSFNGGVFLVAVAGHAVGYVIFGSRAFKKSRGSSGPGSDRRAGAQTNLPSTKC